MCARSRAWSRSTTAPRAACSSSTSLVWAIAGSLYVGGPASSWSDAERRRTLRRTARSLDVTLDEIEGGWSGNHGYDAGPTVLRSRATAVITFNDVEVPAELSVASYDDIPIAAYSRPPHTSLRNERARLGELAWQQLTTRLAGNDWPRPDLLTPSLVVRASTGPVRQRARRIVVAEPRDR